VHLPNSGAQSVQRLVHPTVLLGVGIATDLGGEPRLFRLEVRLTGEVLHVRILDPSIKIASS